MAFWDKHHGCWHSKGQRTGRLGGGSYTTPGNHTRRNKQDKTRKATRLAERQEEDRRDPEGAAQRQLLRDQERMAQEMKGHARKMWISQLIAYKQMTMTLQTIEETTARSSKWRSTSLESWGARSMGEASPGSPDQWQQSAQWRWATWSSARASSSGWGAAEWTDGGGAA